MTQKPIDLRGKKILRSVELNPDLKPEEAGMIVDWVRNGLNEGFEFRNPNERDKCGCGESFSL